MKKIIFWMTALVIAITMAMEAKAQTNQAVQTVRGQVCDVASGEPMIGVTITVENGTTLATVSDVGSKTSCEQAVATEQDGTSGRPYVQRGVLIKK